MTHVAIHTNASRLMAVDTPSHSLVYDAPHAMHLPNLPVTGCAVDASFDVRLMCVIGVGFGFEPVDPLPGRLFFSFGEGCELLNFRTLGLDRLVTTHTGVDIRNSRVSRLIYILVAEGALKLGSFFACFGYVLPVIELDRLERRFRSGSGSQQQESDDCDCRDCQDYEFCQSSHPNG